MDFKLVVDEIKEKIAFYKELTEDYAVLKARNKLILAHSLIRIERVNTGRKQLQARYAELEEKMHALQAELKSL